MPSAFEGFGLAVYKPYPNQVDLGPRPGTLKRKLGIFGKKAEGLGFRIEGFRGLGVRV